MASAFRNFCARALALVLLTLIAVAFASPCARAAGETPAAKKGKNSDLPLPPEAKPRAPAKSKSTAAPIPVAKPTPAAKSAPAAKSETFSGAATTPLPNIVLRMPTKVEIELSGAAKSGARAGDAGASARPVYEMYLTREVTAFAGLDLNKCEKKYRRSSLFGQCGLDTRPVRVPVNAKITYLDQAQFDLGLKPIPPDRYGNSLVRELWYKVRYEFDAVRTKITAEGWIHSGEYRDEQHLGNVGFRARAVEVPPPPVRPEEEGTPWEKFAKRFPGIAGWLKLEATVNEEARRLNDPAKELGNSGAKDPALAAPKAPQAPIPVGKPALPPALPKPPLQASQTICDLILMQRNLQDLVKSNATVVGFLHQLKTSEELDLYLNCFSYREYVTEKRGDKEVKKLVYNGYDDFRAKYKFQIGIAAQCFGVPEAMLTCSLFRESNAWNRDAIYDLDTTSKAGAMGIGQFMQNTIDPIHVILSQRLTEAEHAIFTAELRAWRNDNANSKDPIQKKYEYVRAKYKLIYHSLRQDWACYYSRSNSDPASPYHRRNKGAKHEIIPWKFNKAMAYDPIYAIPASVLWLKHNMLDLDANLIERRTPPISKDPNGTFLVDFMEVITGLYNRGNAKIAPISRVNPPMVSKWKAILATSCETRNHMESIRRCMQKGNAKHPVGLKEGTTTCQEAPFDKKCDLEGVTSAPAK